MRSIDREGTGRPQLFLKPLRALDLLTPGELATVFGNVEELLAVHRVLLAALLARQAEADQQLDGIVPSIADIVADKVRSSTERECVCVRTFAYAAGCSCV
jgi:hypothetical protein